MNPTVPRILDARRPTSAPVGRICGRCYSGAYLRRLYGIGREGAEAGRLLFRYECGRCGSWSMLEVRPAEAS